MNRTTGIAAFSLAFAGAAIAQAPAPNPAANPVGSSKISPTAQFSTLDTNKDGKVSRDEVKSHADITSSFGMLDSDKDTYLSETEFGKWKMPSDPGAPSPRPATPPSNSGASQSETSGQNPGARAPQ